MSWDKGSGERAGFKYTIIEPHKGGQPENKRTFGAHVTIDGSKDRTINDFLITGTSNNPPVTQHSVPALKPGDKVVPELDAYQVTDDAASPMVIKRNRPRDPITATIAGEMDAAAVAKAATEGVAYGWRDQYTADNLDKGTQLFSQTHAEVTVNPWPSETDDCAPITVDWENEKQHVIRPGEKQKVGKVNADEASLERMVVEAYDPQGNFLATNDTAASGGGEGTIEVDPATGEVTYEMPEYKGTKLKDQQSVLFRVLAKPRTVEQLSLIHI